MNKSTEIAILRYLWKAGPAAPNEIAVATGEQADNVTAELEDMVSKGLLALEGSGYRLLLTASEYCAAEVRDMVDQLYSGDAVAFLTDYIGTAGPEDRAALEDAINKGDRQS